MAKSQIAEDEILTEFDAVLAELAEENAVYILDEIE